MRTFRRERLFVLGAVGLLASMLTGCQTWIGGMTLPSPHYLEHHPPQYFPAEPDFPLPNELNYQNEAAGLLNPRDLGAPKNPGPVPGVAPAPNAGGPLVP
jgi:hypothetical protein